jgi:sugar lactone lactonase YvrE
MPLISRPSSKLAIHVALASILMAGTAICQKVTTIAGGALRDGNPGSSAALQYPYDIATDSRGNTYITDYYNQRIRKVDASGAISTFAGNGLSGFGGDGGQAKFAKIYLPTGIAVDAGGNVIFADSGNFRIRKINPQGIISTIAGNGVEGYSGDGGPALNASMENPDGLAIDRSGNIYFSDYYNGIVRRVDASGIIHLFAGTPQKFGFSGDGGPATSALLSGIRGIVSDNSGNVYLADYANERVRKVDTSGTITTFAGNGGYVCNRGNGGLATEANVETPFGLAFIGSQLSISDGCSTVRNVNLQTNIITTYAGNAKWGFNGDGQTRMLTMFDFPHGLAFDRNNTLLLADTNNNRVRKLGPTVQTIAGGYLGDNQSAIGSGLNFPSGIAMDSSGNIYVADTNNFRVRKIDTTGNITTVAGNGLSGATGDGGPAVRARLYEPWAVAFDSNGNMYIADGADVRKVDSSGTISTISAVGSFAWATGIAADQSGNVYVVDAAQCQLFKITPPDVILPIAGVEGVCSFGGDGRQAINAWLHPWGVTADSQGNIYIADYGNNRIRKIDTAGIITTVAGGGMLGYGGDGGPATKAGLVNPYGIAIDSKGDMIIADSFDRRVRFVNTAGIISTYAGDGLPGYNGDGLPATSTNLAFPVGVAVDASGTIYEVDEEQFRVRKIQ